MSDNGFAYMSYKDKRYASNTLDFTEGWKFKYFFISLKNEDLDWAFPKVYIRFLFLGTKKEIRECNPKNELISNLITSLKPKNMHNVYKTNYKKSKNFQV